MSQPGATAGLLTYCGLDSGKHGGQLKRICAPAIGLLRWLVQMESYSDEEENIFFERFVQLPVTELAKINFQKHVLNQSEGGSLLSRGQSRSGSADDAMELLAVLMANHRTVNGEDDPIEVEEILTDRVARERFAAWLKQSNSTADGGKDGSQKPATASATATGDVTSSKQLVAAASATRKTAKRSGKPNPSRPTEWSKVVFAPVPLQEGEEGVQEVSCLECMLSVNIISFE